MVDDGSKLFDFESTGRNEVWEDNHIAIAKAIAKLVRETERFPKKTEIAKETGLSVRTVFTHLKEFGNEQVLADDMEQFKFMGGQVLSKILEMAMDGDLRASRLSLQVLGVIGRKEVKG